MYAHTNWHQHLLGHKWDVHIAATRWLNRVVAACSVRSDNAFLAKASMFGIFSKIYFWVVRKYAFHAVHCAILTDWLQSIDQVVIWLLKLKRFNTFEFHIHPEKDDHYFRIIYALYIHACMHTLIVMYVCKKHFKICKNVLLSHFIVPQSNCFFFPLQLYVHM